MKARKQKQEVKSEVESKAPEGKYRIVGFRQDKTKYLYGDFDYEIAMIRLNTLIADQEEQIPGVVRGTYSCYDDQGKLVLPKTQIDNQDAVA